MNGKQLKNSILQWAIQGRLVPQDPTDEPASRLLRRIQAEKARLVREGKLKKSALSDSVIFRGEDNKYYEKVGKTITCIDKDIPFEIPKTWEWVRLGNVVSTLNGDRGKNYPAKETLKQQGIPFISALNLDGKSIVQDENLLCLSESQYNLLGNGKLLKDDIVVCVRGSLGKHGKYPFEKGAIASSLVILRTYIQQDSLLDYLMIYLDTRLFYFEIKKSDNGTAQPNLAAKKLANFLLPLPPLAEQRRIVAKVEEVLSVVERYEKAQDALDALCNSLDGRLRKSILSEAIRGRLVPQDPADEPASLLLRRIQAEKAKLVKEGKLKKSALSDSTIFRGQDNKYYERVGKTITCIDEDIPFEIPETWEWVRLGNIGETFGGYAFKSTEYTNSGIRVVRISDFDDRGLLYKEFKYFPLSPNLNNYRILSGSILMCMTGGTVGKACLLEHISEEMYLNQRVAMIRSMHVDLRYLYSILISPYIREIIGSQKTSTNDNISMDTINHLLLPLPPLAEQRRIVSKVEELFAVLDRLSCR